tara:strand:- start:306 stop:524 length:219 start_codon:yes stop_codon:yes gene_type:complete
MKNIYEALPALRAGKGSYYLRISLTSFYYIYPHLFIFKLTAAPGLTAAQASYIDKILITAAAFKQHQQEGKK